LLKKSSALLSCPIIPKPFPANVIKLDNGLTLIHQFVAATPVVVVDVWVKAGARKEPDDWSGMAHFLEHMIFKGTEKIFPGVFDQIVENRGGVANAATSHDYAHFHITTASQYLEEITFVLAEILLRAKIPDDEFDRERNVVLEEIRQSTDNPDWLGFQTLMENLYDGHPYARPVLGTEDLLLQYEPAQMRTFHNCHYQPENIGVVIVGNVELDRAKDLVERAFSDFPQPQGCPQMAKHIDAPNIHKIRREKFQLPRLEEARLTMAWLGPGVDNVRDAYGLDLLSILLASGRTSRLVYSLREKLGLVDDIGSGFSLQQDSSLLTISAFLQPEYLDRVEDLICQQLDKFRTHKPIFGGELERCQKTLCNDYAFSTETPGQLAGLYGYYFAISSPHVAITYPDQIMEFTPADLQDLACRYLSPDNYVITILLPEEE
jgi:predicted Zn-dependent peptidase